MTRSTVVLASLMLASGVALAQQQTPPDPPPAATPPPAAAQSAPPAAIAPVAAVDSIKIVCSGKVKANGEVHFTFTPAGGESKAIRVSLMKGMGKSEVCRDIAKELSVMLGGGPYAVDHYDDDKVKVDGKDKAKFSLSLGALSATGVTIELK